MGKENQFRTKKFCRINKIKKMADSRHFVFVKKVRHCKNKAFLLKNLNLTDNFLGWLLNFQRLLLYFLSWYTFCVSHYNFFYVIIIMMLMPLLFLSIISFINTIFKYSFDVLCCFKMLFFISCFSE